MSDEQAEAGEITERFRAFAASTDPQPSRTLPMVLVAAGVGVLLVLAAVVFLVSR